MSHAQKQPSLWYLLTKTKTKVGLVSNLGCEIRKTSTRTQYVQNKNSTKFCCKNNNNNNIITRKHIKLVLNVLKIMGNFNSIYTHWASNSKKIFKKPPTHMWPMFTMYAHVHPYVTHVYPCVNYEWTNTSLKVNWNLIKSELKLN